MTTPPDTPTRTSREWDALRTLVDELIASNKGADRSDPFWGGELHACENIRCHMQEIENGTSEWLRTPKDKP